MKVSKNWLSDYLNLGNVTDKELFDLINAHVCEIESYSKLVEATNLVVGEVLECENHPDSDHLHVCKVNVGSEVLQIVCGAPNVRQGVKVIAALCGAVLPGDFKIKKSKIRGVESFGMLCSLQELGIEAKYVKDEFKDGIYLLGSDATVGSNPLDYLYLNDTVIDLELTSNRSDLLSIEGVAFDLGAVLNQKINVVNPKLNEVSKKNNVNVSVETDSCYKYLTRYIANVKIEESPLFIQGRLIASGIRPINNVVDITNYVLMELGQPLHSFDADKLGENIVVRNALKDEMIVTLDNIERKLEPTDIVITDGKTPLCIAGVMGGLTTEVTNETRNIVLEAAYFDPLAVRKTSSRLGLKSESSIRFERKIDYNRVARALDYAAYLLEKYASGEVYTGVNGKVTKEVETKTIRITTEKINSVLGTSLSNDYITDLFNRLAYTYKVENNEFVISVPSRRMDLEESVQDIIEDVARMYGYNQIPTTIAEMSSLGHLTYRQKRIRNLRTSLAHMGLNECVSYSLINEKNLGLYTTEVEEPIKVLMPLTEDRNVMRESLLNGLLDTVAYNKARKMDDLALFEIGNVYNTTEERLHLAIALSGIYSSSLWQGYKMEASFYLLKGLIDDIFNKFNLTVTYKPLTTISTFHPGRTAGIYVKDTLIGHLGELHPKYAKDAGLTNTVALEIDLDILVNEEHVLKYKPINKFPQVERDLAIVVKKDIDSSAVLNVIKKACKHNLVDAKIFDVYSGVGLANDEKSIAFNLVFEDTTKTLETKEVDDMVSKILSVLDKELGAHLR